MPIFQESQVTNLRICGGNTILKNRVVWESGGNMHLNLLTNIQYEQMAALFDLILCAFLVFDETEAKEDSSRWFTSYLYFVTIANGVEILAVIFSSQGFHVSPAIKMAITSISFFMNNLAFWQFFNYIEASAKERSTFVNRIIGVNRILLAAEVFLLLTNLFLHNAFYFSDKMEYTRGPYFAAVTFLLPLYFIVVALVLVKRNNQRMGRRKVASILVASVLNMVGLILQIYFHGTLLMALPFASLGIFVLYFAVESPDYRQLESTLHELSEAKQTAEEASKSKDVFMSQISHEVRTPMNSIMGLTDMILQEMQGKDQLTPAEFSKVYQYLHGISNSGHQLIYIVDNIQNYITTIPAEETEEAPVEGTVYRMGGEQMELQTPEAHFLVVDDNEMNLFVAKKLLSKTGARVTTCTGGLECLRALTKEKFDLVFLDYMMPDMDGIDVMERTRKMVGNLNENTPFVMVTANTVAGMEARALEAGFADFISKPISWDRLYMVLSAHLPNSQMEVQKEDGDYQIQSASDTAAPMELFDTATGMEYCLNDKDFYRETLEVFGQEHDAKAAEIATYYEAADWKLFTVRVHGLKSTARTVGALKLSELAKELEMAGKKLQENSQDEETLTFVREKLPELYDLYQRTVAAIVQLKL